MSRAQLYTNIRTGKWSGTVDFLVADLHRDCVLGLPWLRQNEANVQFGPEEVLLHPKSTTVESPISLISAKTLGKHIRAGDDIYTIRFETLYLEEGEVQKDYPSDLRSILDQHSEVWEMIASQAIIMINRNGVKKASSGNTDYIFIVSSYHDPRLSIHRAYIYPDIPSSTTRSVQERITTRTTSFQVSYTSHQPRSYSEDTTPLGLSNASSRCRQDEEASGRLSQE